MFFASKVCGFSLVAQFCDIILAPKMTSQKSHHCETFRTFNFDTKPFSLRRCSNGWKVPVSLDGSLLALNLYFIPTTIGITST